MKQEDKIRKYSLGLAQIPLLLMLLLLAIAVPVATKLVQQRQEMRRGAVGESYECQRYLCGLRACIGVCSPTGNAFVSVQNATGCLDTGDYSSVKTTCTVIVPPACRQIGDVCENSSDCCNNNCAVVNGAKVCLGTSWAKGACDNVTGKWNCTAAANGTYTSQSACEDSDGCDVQQPTGVPPTGVPPTGVPPTGVPPTAVPPTGEAKPTCNTSAVTLSVAPGTVAASSPVTFNISGSASTYIGDNYDGGASRCSGTWNSKACTSSATAGIYTWTHTWKNCVGDLNHCSNTCSKSVTYVVAAPTVAKTCSIISVSTAIGSATITYSGRGNEASEPVRLWLEKTDGSVFATLPGGNEGTYPSPQNSAIRNAVRGGSCNSVAGASCQITKTFTNLVAGNYYVHCDLTTDPNKCSGNPFCDYEKPQKPGGNVCTGWTSCSTSDNKSFAIATATKYTPGTCSKVTGNYACTASSTGTYTSASACETSSGCDVKYAAVAGSCNTTTGNWTCAPSATGTFNTDALCKASSGCDIATTKYSRGICNTATGSYTCTASATGFDTAAACQASTGCDVKYAAVAGSCNTTTGNWTCAPSATGTFNTDALCKASTGCDIASSTDLVLKYRMAFAGLKPGAKCAVDWTTNLIVKGGTQEKTYGGLVAVKTTEVNSNGDMIYKVEKGLTGFTQKTAVAAFIKGIKHLQMKYGKNSQTGTYGKAGGELTLKTVDETGHTVYDFTGYPLLAGDVDQNGVINAIDFTMVKAKASTYAQVDEGGYLLEDLDGSCQVNTADITLLVKSLDEKQAELY